MKKLLFLLLLVLFWEACSQSKEPDVSHIKMEVQLIDLDKDIVRIQNMEDALGFLSAYPEFALYYTQSSQVSYDTAAADFLRIAQSSMIDTLRYWTVQELPVDKLKKEFEQAFRYIKYYFPDFEAPKIYTSLTGFAYDLVLQPDFMLISLDHFLKNAPYRHPEMPNYMLKRYQPKYLVPYACQMLSARYNKSAFLDKTLLAEMIFYGKSYEFVKKTNPHVPDSIILGYSGQELADLNFNEEYVYGHFVQNNLFYEKSHFIKNKYISERPFTGEISSKSPGRIGQWVGWQIVKSFLLKNPKVTLDSLMRNENAQEIFEAAKYKPVKKE